MIQNAELTLKATRGHGGRAVIEASIGGNAVARDSVELQSAADRRRLADAIHKAAPALAVELIETELLAIDPATLPKANGKAERPLCRPKVVRMADVQSRPVPWLWQDRFPAGRVSLIVGAPGCGKSFLTCDFAARVSSGMAWPDGAPCKPGSVLFVTAEDDAADTIRPRLDACGADVNRVHLLEGTLVDSGDGEETETLFSLADIDALEAALTGLPDCRLLVIDPIGSFIGGRIDSHRDNQVRSVLAPLAKLAERTGVAVVIVAHRRKGNSGSADDSAMGSRGFVGLARQVWHLSQDNDDRCRRLLLPGKCNLTAEPSGLAFRIEGSPPAVEWEPDPVLMNADDAMELDRAAETEDRSAKAEAVNWLRDALAGGPQGAKETKARAKADGLAERTLDRAADSLGVIRGKDGFGGRWVWQLPEASPAPILANDSHSRQAENLGVNGQTWRECPAPGPEVARERGAL